MLGGSNAAPAVMPAVSGIVGVFTRFIIPIAAAGAGWMTGTQIASGIGDWVVSFVPGLSKVQTWAQTKDKSMYIGLILGGIIVISVGLLVAYLLRSFLGGGLIAAMVSRGVASYALGAGIHSVINGFGPAKAAVEAIA